jgi:hypothetical protein
VYRNPLVRWAPAPQPLLTLVPGRHLTTHSPPFPSRGLRTEGLLPFLRRCEAARAWYTTPAHSVESWGLDRSWSQLPNCPSVNRSFAQTQRTSQATTSHSPRATPPASSRHAGSYMPILETPSTAPRCGFVPSLIKKGQGGALLDRGPGVVGCLANFSLFASPTNKCTTAWCMSDTW